MEFQPALRISTGKRTQGFILEDDYYAFQYNRRGQLIEKKPLKPGYGGYEAGERPPNTYPLPNDEVCECNLYAITLFILNLIEK